MTNTLVQVEPTEERAAFERTFKMPSQCVRCGDGYAATGYNAWDAHTFIAQWQGWKARAAAPTVQAEPASLCDSPGSILMMGRTIAQQVERIKALEDSLSLAINSGTDALEAKDKELAAANARIKQAREALPDDIRAAGWAVAVHNDYRLAGEAHTFWLFTKDGIAVKGEGKTDADALIQVRAAIERHQKGEK